MNRVSLLPHLTISMALIDIHRNKDGLYQGNWEYDELRHRYRGNPVDAPRVKELIKSIRNMYAKDGERNHSLAMSLESLESIYACSEKLCPVESVDAHIEDANMEQRTLRTTHLMRNAFFSLAFVLWTR